jgi:alkylation response protein AidB-like acyl-CoA dehydrogenase/flavin-dependent dehydrogenase/electron transfer flavoprotein alpha/beta subunit/ferredoxin-like protein FixX
MILSNYDVVVVGAGAAGLTAAIGLARAGFAVAAIEAAPFPGAENWSGCVYFCENLAHPDILGPEGVEALAWERRLVERGFFGCDGYSLLGMKYRDPEAFRHCYTVLRPIYDHHLAQVALRQGVALLSNTTVESLIRERGRVIGVCTNRGPLYADLVFLAEGDASHLVTREGYERFSDQRQAPKFLQGIKQVFEMPAGAIEKLFGVGPEEGVAYEMVLRNGTLRGRNVHLNMGGFLYTNRQSLSIGLVLPADNLHEHFEGDPNLLMEWFGNLPALKPWLEEGVPGVFGAKIIRGGGARDIPNLIDNGLAIGGAASAIGIDFPYPNFTGPATAMGLLITHAACKIRDAGGSFTRENLARFYLEPLQATHYWKDVEFLHHWPGYVKRTQVFFDRNLDLALGTAYIWTRPKRWFFTKWINWLRLLLEVAGPSHWRQMRADFQQLIRALRLRQVISRPGLGQLLLDGTINALRDLAHSPRANLPAAGSFGLVYVVADGSEITALPPGRLVRWFQRLAPVLASAARLVYKNDGEPLAVRLPRVSSLLLRQINVLDLCVTAGIILAAGIGSCLLTGWDRLIQLFRRRPSKGLYPRYARAARQAADLTTFVTPAGQRWDSRLGAIAYETVRESHIHVLWPKMLPNKNGIASEGLWHVCPAHVYEARVSAQGQLQVVVNFENCIKCETCWRTSDRVDWGRDGQHRFVYAVSSPVVGRLLEAVSAAGTARPALPRAGDPWQAIDQSLSERLQAERSPTLNGQATAEMSELFTLTVKLESKVKEFDAALAREPRTIDRDRAEYLEMLARYVQQLAARMVEVLRESSLADSPNLGVVATQQQLLEMASTLLARAEERARFTWDKRFAWAASAGRQLCQHHLVGIRCLLNVLSKYLNGPAPEADPVRSWLQAEVASENLTGKLAELTVRLDSVFPPTAWRTLEQRVPLTTEQDAVLRDLIAQVPRLDPADLGRTLHPALRKGVLAELGRRDPSLAYRVASHLWARDIASLRSVSSALAAVGERWARGDEWACFASIEAAPNPDGQWNGETLFVPAGSAGSLLLLLGDQLAVVPMPTPGVRLEPLVTLGLRGAGLRRVCLENLKLPETHLSADYERVHRVWQVLSALDLTSIASGMADQLCRRAIQHATSRVQFPGLFQDEEARDTIGKFGAIKQMVAEMAARRYLLEVLDHTLSPGDFSAASVERAGLIKALAAEALGTSPGSLAYNAGQIFGGTGYSEDDILSKFYRDAAAWRQLGTRNVEVYFLHGEQLLRSWHPDGRRLANLEQEAILFDQLAQRKALQAELDEVRVLRSRLRSVVNDWQATRKERGAAAKNSELGQAPDPVALAEVTERLGRQDAHLLAAKALLLRTHARLEHDRESEAEVLLTRLWLAEAAASLDEFEAAARRRLEANRPRDDRPVVDPDLAPALTTYAGYLAASCPYETGDFLVTPIDAARPRFVPELVETDPSLAERDRRLQQILGEHFSRPREPGLCYERYLERRHRPDPQDLDLCRQHGFFRMLIPPELGGEGRQKVDYYLLTTNAQRLSDFAISLTIQASTSIGTTPIFLARDRDLPKALKDLELFASDLPLQREIRVQLEKLLRLLNTGMPRRIEQALTGLQKRLEGAILPRPALRALAHGFVHTWQQVGQPAANFDLMGLSLLLKKALEHWQKACARAKEFREELGRRLEACDLFLRWIASGQISAFALTEPAAGSDTARVATHARLRSVPVERDEAGVWHFLPVGSKEPRWLLDTRKLEFRADGAYYRWSESEPSALLHFEEYDYETDDPQAMRYFEVGPRRIPFTDIAQLRERDGQLWYDYWELTGAKMWITNGRMAGVFCLYAKTEEGVTGFLVDRHAEGLIVGKDEAKMGQLGSPTNELSLQAVRVPRENVLGLEGRGQVNALETLNVGRAGLAMSAMTQMAGLIESSREVAQATFGYLPDWAAWRLQEMEAHRFTAEAVAHEVIGRFEHPGTKSVPLESAIAKLLISELLHRVIELAEDIHGLAGQTERHLVEKRKRDARILTIYEGTNEIQRFLILKMLAAEVAPRWSGAAASPLGGYLGREALELETLRAELRQQTLAAVECFGQELWQNPSLQANCFLLAEAVVWLKAAESTLGRLAWLERQAQVDEDVEPDPKLEIARRAFVLCVTELRHRLNRFRDALTHLRRGYYAPAIRAASILFDREPGATRVEVERSQSQITQPLSILVIVEPTAASVPHPQIAEGRLLEPHFTLSAADRSALETALHLRDRATGPVTIQVAAVGPRASGQALREALSLGADRVRFVVWEQGPLTPDCAARALTAMLGGQAAFDLVLGGSTGADSEEGLVACLTAAGRGVPYGGTATGVIVSKTETESEITMTNEDGKQRRIRPLPAAVLITSEKPLRAFSINGYMNGLAKALEVEHWPRKLPVRAIAYRRPGPAPSTLREEPSHALSPIAAAKHLLNQLGAEKLIPELARSSPSERGVSASWRKTEDASAHIYEGAIEDVLAPSFPEGSIVAVVAANAQGLLQPSASGVLRSAELIAQAEGRGLGVLLAAPDAEACQRRALARILQIIEGDIVVLSTALTEFPQAVLSRLLRQCWPNVAARGFMGESWTEEAFIGLSRRTHAADPVALRVQRLALEEGQILLETQRDRGKLCLRQTLPASAEGPCWITLTGDAEACLVAPGDGIRPRVQRWSPRLERFYGSQEIHHLLAEIRQDTGLSRLTDADVVIDVGFGVGNRDGYEAIIVPLEQALRDLGVRNLAVGGSRKVTEELHLLPVDSQIGQSGVRVHPQLLLAIGISGAPQHMNYIGPGATILAFNRDHEAPLMTLNLRQPRPKVYAIVGDLFETVPAFVAALRQEPQAEPLEAVERNT